MIDGYEHDASTTLQQRFYEIARYMARTRHIAGVLGLYASSASMARIPAALRITLEGSARAAAEQQRAMGHREDTTAMTELTGLGMTINDIDASAFRQNAEQLWVREARALDALRWLDTIRGPRE